MAGLSVSLSNLFINFQLYLMLDFQKHQLTLSLFSDLVLFQSFVLMLNKVQPDTVRVNMENKENNYHHMHCFAAY